MHALIKNNEAATTAAQAILPMLFVSIDRKCRDRKYLLLTVSKRRNRAGPTVYGSHQPCRSQFPRVVLPLMWAVGT